MQVAQQSLFVQRNTCGVPGHCKMHSKGLSYGCLSTKPCIKHPGRPFVKHYHVCPHVSN